MTPSEFLHAYASTTGQVLLITAGFALVEWFRPAERGQSWRRGLFNIEYLLLSQALLTVLLPFLVALIVGSLRSKFPGAFGLIKLNSMVDGGWKSLVYLLIFDFFYYWFHRLQHTWPALWEEHKLHHSETALNVTTSWRHHWLEEPIRIFFIMLPMSVAFDITPAATGVASFALMLWPFFIHANLRLSFGPLSPIIAGPQVHRIHHSFEAQHLNRNYAAFFPVWDVLFGTFFHPHPGEYPGTGLATGEQVTTLWQAALLPFPAWFGFKRSTPAAQPPAGLP